MKPVYEISRPELRGIVAEALDEALIGAYEDRAYVEVPLGQAVKDKIMATIEKGKFFAYGVGVSLTNGESFNPEGSGGDVCYCPARAAGNEIYNSNISGNFPSTFDVHMRQRFGSNHAVLKVIDGHPGMTA